MFSKNVGTCLFLILLASSSTTAVLPTPASPISNGLFLFFLLRISIISNISLSLPITGSSEEEISFRLVPIEFKRIFSLINPIVSTSF